MGGHEVRGVDARRTCLRQPEEPAECRRVRVPGQELPERPGEVGVADRSLPAVPGHVGGRVGGRLGQQHGAGLDLLQAVAQHPGDLVVQVVGAHPARHVAHVDAPAVKVERLLEPAHGHRVVVQDEACAQRLGVPVELRQRGHAQPGHVLTAVLVEVVVLPLRSAGVVAGGEEPVVPGAGVVGGQVPDHAQAPGVRRGDQGDQCRVAAEQLVDPVEARGVVAVVGFGGEDRGQVEHRGTELREVAQAFLDAGQVPAVELPAGVFAAALHRGVPVAGDHPAGRRLRGAGVGEPVGEDLVHDGFLDPVRGPVAGMDPEVVRVRHVPAVQACGIEPAVLDGPGPIGVGQVPPVALHRVDDGQRRLEPGGGAVLPGRGRRLDVRLAVAQAAQPDPDGAPGDPGHAQPHQQLVSDLRDPRTADVEWGSVVVRGQGQ